MREFIISILILVLYIFSFNFQIFIIHYHTSLTYISVKKMFHTFFRHFFLVTFYFLLRLIWGAEMKKEEKKSWNIYDRLCRTALKDFFQEFCECINIWNTNALWCWICTKSILVSAMHGWTLLFFFILEKLY